MTGARTQTVHLIEQVGQGGIFQHTLALAALLASKGVKVRLHTAADSEQVPADTPVDICPCVEWFRDGGRLRKPLIASRYVARTLPHLVSEVARGDVVHVQGVWNADLAALTIAALRRRGRLVFSPHNTFARSGSHRHDRLLRRDLAAADATIVYSEYDRSVIGDGSVPSFVSPLIQPRLEPADAQRNAWRAAWGVETEPVALFAGQLRADKRLDRVIAAIREMSEPPLLAVVGEDKGAASGWREAAARAGVRAHWSVGFQPLERFAGAVAAADVVVCPYERASQSAVISLAAGLGTPTIATSVGGLTESATFVVEGDDHRGLAKAIETAINAGRSDPRPDAEENERAWRAHADAYGLHRWIVRHA
jgi:glycosyltransferase involved in cell wall biosynthesis